MVGTTSTTLSTWRAYVRIAGLAALFVTCLPPHLLSKWLLGRSRWPRRFLAAAARIAGARVRVEGKPLGAHTLAVVNHTSWLDILILGGATGTAFVSKAEVQRTPLIGWLSDQNHTLYIERAERGDAHGQVRRISDRLSQAQPLTVFPEGTTGDGKALLKFRSTLLDAVAPPFEGASVRPVAIDYGANRAAIGWSGGEAGKDNVLKILGRSGSFEVIVRLLKPLERNENRKALAGAAQVAIEAALAASTSAGLGL
ncbi:1-acyl-sn-glycerol-3-phosphate acyltransferase [Sphingomonas sp.]|uniref:lysophospholipid acyltransferase family protein n=1 Tax=Sphingomonas sp. TaxID=28214 RepID=UPI0025ED07FA|nr:1-acyl-sn-glycerol-3-phosphate acyltransferase [Sphingomonas sp.]